MDVKIEEKKTNKTEKEELDIWGVDDVNVILSQIYFPRRLFIFSLFIFAVRNFFLVIDELLNLKKNVSFPFVSSFILLRDCATLSIGLNTFTCFERNSFSLKFFWFFVFYKEDKTLGWWSVRVPSSPRGPRLNSMWRKKETINIVSSFLSV